MSNPWFAILGPADKTYGVSDTFVVQGERRFMQGLAWYVAQTAGTSWLFAWDGQAWQLSETYRRGVGPKPFWGSW